MRSGQCMRQWAVRAARWAARVAVEWQCAATCFWHEEEDDRALERSGMRGRPLSVRGHPLSVRSRPH